jgi:hypothetical protein
MIIPPFTAMQQAGRLGTHSVYPDSDGVVRTYPVRTDAQGWLIPSLPYVVAKAVGKGGNAPDKLLLNWRGKPFTYRYVSFSDVYLDMLKEKRTRPANEFKGKTSSSVRPPPVCWMFVARRWIVNFLVWRFWRQLSTICSRATGYVRPRLNCFIWHWPC